MKNILATAYMSGLEYESYRNLVTDLIREGKSTGDEQNESLLEYSKLNDVRMNRLDKTLGVFPEILERMSKLQKRYIWLVLAEGWCGDAAQLLPVMHKMSLASDQISLKVVLRDANDGLMQMYLTNGARSIPKLLIMDKETMDIVADWGPRPAEATKLIVDYKKLHGVVDEPIKIELQKWYLHDKGLSTQREILDILEKLEE